VLVVDLDPEQAQGRRVLLVRLYSNDKKCSHIGGSSRS
jgi:hypothetical protein